MSKKTFLQLFVGLFVLVAASSAAMAQKATPIVFKKDTSSASVSGTLKPGGSREYVMRVREGQEINAVVSGKDVQLDNGMLTMNYPAPAGPNYIKVINHGRKSTRYTMTVSIQ